MTHETQCTALVVDDEPAITELLSCILRSVNVQVLIAQDGAQAVDVLAKNMIDVVVTDIRMKGVSGFDLLHHVKETDDSISVIVMTGHDSYDMVKHALRSNAYDYLNKPLADHEEVISTVKRAFENVRLIRDNRELIDSLRASNAKVTAANKRLLLLNKRLRTLAITDGLTQLYNRRYIDDWIQNFSVSQTNYNARYSILLLDVDHFKTINDSFGHDCGDKVLRHLANVLVNVKRDSDVVGRYGGEEFIVVLPNTDQYEAIQIAERVRSTIEAANINVITGIVRITVSIGVSSASMAGSADTDAYDLTPAEALFSGRALVAQADRALYAAKDQGRNLSLHYNELTQSQPNAA